MAAIDMCDYSKTRCRKLVRIPGVIDLIQLHTLMVMIIAISAALIFSLLYWIIILCAPGSFIPVAMLLQIATSVTLAVYYFCARRWMSGTFSIIWLLFIGTVYFLLRQEIPEATKTLQRAIRVAKKFPAIFMSSAFAALFPTGMTLLTGMMSVSNFAKSRHAECSLRGVQRPPAEFVASLVFCTFGTFMLIELVRGVMRASICAVYGSWYYNPTFHGTPLLYGFGRSCSYSLGTITIGTFLLACAATLSLLSSAAAQALTLSFHLDPSVIMSLWLVSHIIGLLHWILSAFCNYVYAHTAVYNSTFAEGAKQTVTLWRQQGWQAYRNELLASGLLTFVPMTVGILTGLTCLVYLHYIRKEEIQGMAFLISYAILAGTNIANMFVAPVSAGVQTLFVISCRHPHVLSEKHRNEPGAAI